MKKQTFLIVLIIVLFAINVFTLVRFYNLHQLFEVIAENKTSKDNSELQAYRFNLSIAIKNSNLQLENVTMKDSSSNLLFLKGVFKNGQKELLVCRFSKLHCESCVNSAIKLFLKGSESIGVENVLFLGNSKNNRIFNRENTLYGIQDMAVYNTPEFKIPIEELGYPYFFVLDSNLHISNVFLPDKGIPKITKEYLKEMQNIFK